MTAQSVIPAGWDVMFLISNLTTTESFGIVEQEDIHRFTVKVAEIPMITVAQRKSPRKGGLRLANRRLAHDDLHCADIAVAGTGGHAQGGVIGAGHAVRMADAGAIGHRRTIGEIPFVYRDGAV